MVDELEPDAIEEDEQGLEEQEEVETKAGDELAQLRRDREELMADKARLEGRLEVLGTKKEPEQEVEDPLAYLDDEQFQEDFFENAGNALRPVRDLYRLTGTALLARDRQIAELRQELESLRESKSDPEMDARIADLKKDPDLAGLPRASLAAIAKKFGKSTKREFPGSAPSGGRATGGSSGDSRLDKTVAKKLAAIYGEDEDA